MTTGEEQRFVHLSHCYDASSWAFGYHQVDSTKRSREGVAQRNPLKRIGCDGEN